MQIADDRKARSLRMDQGLPANEVATVTSVVAASGSAVAGNAAADTCRVQVRGVVMPIWADEGCGHGNMGKMRGVVMPIWAGEGCGHANMCG